MARLERQGFGAGRWSGFLTRGEVRDLVRLAIDSRPWEAGDARPERLHPRESLPAIGIASGDLRAVVRLWGDDAAIHPRFKALSDRLVGVARDLEGGKIRE
jgi:hypothetical protein